MTTQTTITNDLHEKAIAAAQKAVLLTMLPNGGAPVGWGHYWSNTLAEDIVEIVLAAGIEHVSTRDVTSYAFSSSSATDGQRATGWPITWQENAAANAIAALRDVLPNPVQNPTTPDVLTVVLAHLAQIDTFLRTETPDAAGTITANRDIMNTVRAALATKETHA